VPNCFLWLLALHLQTTRIKTKMSFKISAVAADCDKHSDDIECAVLAGDILFTGSDDGHIKAWSTDLELVQSWQAHEYVVYDLAVDHTGQTLFSCSMDGEIKSWWLGGLRSGPPSCVNQAIQTGPVGDGVGGGMGGGEEGGPTGPVTVRKLLFRDGSLFAGDEAGSLCRWSPNLELENKMEYYTEIWSMAIDKAAKVAYTARDNDVVVASLHKGGQASNIVSVTNTFAGRAPVALAPDDSVLVCCNRTSAMDIQVMRRVGEEQKMKQCQLLAGRHDMIVNSVVVDEANVISGGWDQHVVIWKLEEGEYKFSEAVKLDSYVNILCTGSTQVYYAGGKSGYLVKVSRS